MPGRGVKCPPARLYHAKSDSDLKKSAEKGQKLPRLRAGIRQKPRLRATGGFTLIELLVVVVILGILATIGSNLMGAREKAYIAVMKADLHNLATEQALYAINNYEYSNSAPDLPFTISEGITMELLGETRGFTARTTHRGFAGASCAIFMGTVSSIYSPATVCGVITCDDAAAGGATGSGGGGGGGGPGGGGGGGSGGGPGGGGGGGGSGGSGGGSGSGSGGSGSGSGSGTC